MTSQLFLQRFSGLVSSSYYSYLWCYRLYLQLQGRQSAEKIVVYQMGKVGSTTIWRSLESLNLGIPVYHVHRLSPEAVKRGLQKAKDNFSSLKTIHPEVVHAEYLRSQLDQLPLKKPWKVITLVRDPVARTISKFFEKNKRKILVSKAEVDSGNQNYQETLEKLLTAFSEKYIQDANPPHPYLWFERELKANFGCDLFSETDIKNKQYHICNVENAEVLLLKLEHLKDCHQSALQKFLGIDNFTLKSENVSSKKEYGSLYKDFLNQVKLSSAYLDGIYNSNLIRRFYSDAEIEQFYQRWEKCLK
ncbi:MAG: putative capsular polysaccharide synthesis family protein [Cyanophyceae cyanobacterium]